MGTYGAGAYTVVQVDTRDSNNNWQAPGPQAGYTIATSPTYVTADATNNYRLEGGVPYFNAPGNYRLFQGYYSSPSLNYTSYLYYGTKIATACSGKSITGIHMRLARIGGGINRQDMIRLYMHDATSSPGTSYTTPAHPIYGAGHNWGTLAYSQEAWNWLSAEMVSALAAGSRRGIALYDPTNYGTGTGKSTYMYNDSISEDGQQGYLAIYHLG
jgi:hypothetical protein